MDFFLGWISRARGHPLTLSLERYAYTDVPVIVGRYAHQLRELHLGIHSAYPEVFHAGASFPSLETLSFRDGYQEHPYDVQETARIFQCAPNLIECKLGNRAHHPVPLEAQSGLDIVHSHLQSLEIQNQDASSTFILPFLTLPALKCLEIEFTTNGADELGRFLARSSPPLQKLILHPGYVPWARETIKDCFERIPTLTRLVLSGPAEFQERFIAVLAGDPSHQILPNLTNLTIFAEDFSDKRFYARLAYFLVGRQKSPHATVKLQSFRLQWKWYYAGLMPKESMKSVLRPLVADGMEIYMGFGGANELMNDAPWPVPPSSVRH
ncbi:hypothetical protein FB451DRAFT_1513702 [Mycena latifolia]|nr:hypothetical protein FB451DRAFT_1513702 [Mycena latifolia]